MTGPPLSISMDFIAGGLVELIGGVASRGVLFAFAWWAPLVLAGAWLATHWLLRESAVWRDRNTDEVRAAQRDADYAYRLAVDPPAAKELRLFGLADWTIDRFIARRTRAARAAVRGDAAAREAGRSGACSLVVGGERRRLLGARASARRAAGSTLGAARRLRAGAVGVSLIAFGGFSWALDGAAAPVAAVLRLEAGDGAGRRAARRAAASAAGMPAREIRFRDVTLRATPARRARARGLRPHDPGRVVARDRRAERRRQDDAREAALPPLRPAVGRDRGRRRRPARRSTSTSWRARVTAVFQDFIRFELPLRDNVAPGGAPDDVDPRARSTDAGAATLAELDTVLARGYDGRHRPLRRAVAARRAGARAVRRAARARASCCSTSRPRSSTCAARPRSSSASSRRRAHCTTILDLAPLLDRAPRRPHLRARARPRRRARHARRADGAGRPLPHDVRSAGAALRRDAKTRRERRMTSSPDDAALAPTICRRRCRRCGGCASSATATSRG